MFRCAVHKCLVNDEEAVERMQLFLKGSECGPLFKGACRVVRVYHYNNIAAFQCGQMREMPVPVNLYASICPGFFMFLVARMRHPYTGWFAPRAADYGR